MADAAAAGPKVKVIFAVYGGLRDGNPDNAWQTAKDVTQALQTAIDNAAGLGQTVKIDNKNMGGDPAKHVKKQFGAIVEVNGVRRAFACQENETIDFT
jgi:hypothetical protein